MIAVRDVRERGNQDTDIGAATVLARRHVKRDDVVAGVALQSHSIYAGRQIVGYRELKIRLPCAVIDIVVVKVDGTVLFRGVPPAHLGTVPV